MPAAAVAAMWIWKFLSLGLLAALVSCEVDLGTLGMHGQG